MSRTVSVAPPAPRFTTAVLARLAGLARIAPITRVAAVAIAVGTVTGACGGIVEVVEPDSTSAPDASVQTSPTSGQAPIGQSCTSDKACTGTAIASALTCMELHGNVPFPGGYCSQTCSTDSDCAGDAFCGISGYDLGDLARCMARCTPDDASCRSSYTCLQVTDTSKQAAYGCWTVPRH